MKRLFLMIPMLLLFLVNSCVAGMPISANAIGTALIQTQTATMWTVIPTQTFNPIIPDMVNWLNADLVSTANSLRSTLDAEYNVNNISFPYIPDSSALIFRVDVGCICRKSADCCIPERTFVVIVETMKMKFGTTLAQVPAATTQIIVICSNPQTKEQIGAVAASWQDVKGYLQGNVTGYQLGIRTTRTVAP